MKLSDLIEINAHAKEALIAFRAHYNTGTKVSEYQAVSIPLAKLIGKTDALLWIHSHNIELEVK
jgi:hypothetical protein